MGNTGSFPARGRFRDSTQEAVTSHYNARPNTSVEERVKSPIYHLRNFNNWIKSCLIAEFTPPRAVVLDLCCGKGGDLPKWCSAAIRHWVAADIAGESVKAAEERYESRRTSFSALFVTTDCFETRLSEHLDGRLWFDLVNCQFALHYAFSSEARVLTLLRNASDRLKNGGWFIGTVPNANWIVKKIRNCEANTFGNSVYSIKFPPLKDQEPRVFPAFGAQYTFSLTDAVQDVPEYLVHFPTLERLAAQVGLKLRMKRTFHEVFCEKVKKDADLHRLLFRMEAVDEHGTITPEEWEAAGIYIAFAFQKVGEPRNNYPSLHPARKEVLVIQQETTKV